MFIRHLLFFILLANRSVCRYNMIMNKLKELLEANETSIYRLSKISGVPKTTLVDICSGKSDIEKCSAGTLYNIAEALGCDMRDILAREESSYKIAPVLTIIGGVNGSGKSSFTGAIRHNDKRLGVIIDVDKMTAELEKGQGKKSKESKLSGARKAIELSKSLMEEGRDFTQESTIAGRSIISTIKNAKEKGYKIRLFYVGVSSPEECIRRVQGRVARGGHDISETDIRRRFESQAESFARMLPLIDEGFIYDNENGFKECARITRGEVVKTTKSYPKWVKEMI